MLKALIVDDESRNRDTLEKMLINFCPDVEILDKVASVDEAINSANPFQALIKEAETSQNISNQIQNLTASGSEEEDSCQERCKSESFLTRLTCLIRCNIDKIKSRVDPQNNND